MKLIFQLLQGIINVLGLLFERALTVLDPNEATFGMVSIQNIDEGLSFNHLVLEQILDSLITQLARQIVPVDIYILSIRFTV